MAKETPTVACSILNWNNYDDTAQCIENLRQLQYPEIEVFLVDNGSTDGSAERLAQEFPDVNLLWIDENRGFSGGHNVAIERAKEMGAEYVWILNNDILFPDSGVLGVLINRLEADSTIGCISPLVLRYPDSDQIWFSRGRVDAKRGVATHVNDVGRDEGLITDTGYLPFCATLFPTDIFDEAGLLPEDYFLYMEDADYCQRLKKKGYDVAVDTDVTLFHKESASSGGKVSSTSLYYMARNRWTLARKTPTGISPGFAPDFLRWMAVQSMRCVYHNRPDGIVALIRGTRDGWWNVTGKGPYP
jgi:GT2 family glycosyltransferase